MANTLMVEINGEAGGLFSILAQVNRRLADLQGSAGNSAASARKSLGHIEQGASSLEGSVIKAGVALGALRSILMGIQSTAREALDANLALERSQRTLEMATGDGAAAMAFVKRLSKELGLELVTTAQGYAMMSAAAKGTSMEGAKTQEVFTSVARATAAMSLSAEQTHGVLLALSQMISKGKVQSEELRRQLGEHLPGAFNIAARAMGVTTSKLDEMLRAGDVISSDFLPKFAAELQRTLGDAPERAANSLQANINRMKTAFQSLAYEAGQGGGSSSLSAALKEISDRLNSPETVQGARVLGANLGNLMGAAAKLTGVMWNLRDGLLAIGVGWAGLKVAAIVQALRQWATTKMAMVSATLAGRTALVQEAAAEAGLTLSTKTSAAAQIAKAQALHAASVAAIENRIAMAGVTTADMAAARAAAAVTTAKLAQAAAAAGAAGAMGAASGAMALLGGPIGVAMLALGGLALMWAKISRSAEEAAASSQKFHDQEMASIATWDELGKKAEELDRSIRSGKLSKDEATLANQRFSVALQNLVDQYPEILGFLKDEAGHQRTIAEAIRLANAERVNSLRLQMEEAEAGRKALEELVATRKQWVEYGKARVSSARNNSEMYAANRDTSYAEKELKADEDSLRMQVIIAKQAQEKWEAVAKLSAVAKSAASGSSEDGKPSKAVESTFTQEMLRITEARVKSEVQLTLEARQQAEIRQAEIDLAKEMDRIADKRAKEGWSSEQTMQVETAAKEAFERKINVDIPNKYAELGAKERDRVEKIETQAAVQHAEVIEKMQDAHLQHLYDSGRISLAQRLAMETIAEEKRYQASFQAMQERLRLVREDAAERARINADIQRLEDQHNLRMQQIQLQGEQNLSRTNFKQGIRSYILESREALIQWGTMAKGVMQGVEDSFASGLKGMLTGNMKLGDGLKSIWKGIADTVIGALAQMAAKWLMAAIAQAIFGKQQKATSLAAAEAAEVTAAAGFWAAYSWMPFVGTALALANIGIMEATMAAMKTKAVVANANGSLVTSPTLALIGEGGQNEVVAPEIVFQDWAGNLTRNIIRQERQAQDYRMQAAQFATQAPNGPRGLGDIHIHGNVIPRDSAEWQDMIADARKGYDQRNG